MSEQQAPVVVGIRSLIGMVLNDRYRVEQVLGQGGMAWVVGAFDQEKSREVAIKVLQPQLAEKPPILQRFLNEAQLQAKLKHPHIAKIFAIQQSQGMTYIVMEWIRGENMRDLMKRFAPPYALDTLFYLALPMCSAIAEAHALNMVHRDIKPENFLIDWQDGQPTIKVTDFGLAKILGEVRDHQTKTGMMMGTVAYMSPEQANETKSVDHRADIYSLGICLYEFATGVVPFRGSMHAVLLGVLSKEPTDPRELNPYCTDELAELILKCIHKSPNKRFQTCEELLAALHSLMPGTKWSPGEPIELAGFAAPTPDLDEEDLPTSSEYMETVDSQSLTSGAFSQDFQVDEEETPPISSSKKPIFIGLFGLLACLLIGGAAYVLMSGNKTKPTKHPAIVASCQEGETKTCYTGPTGTKGKGPCKEGTKTCKGGQFGPCQKQVLPQRERCNDKDDDCDGKIDNAKAFANKGKACETATVGACRYNALYTCSQDGKELSCQRAPNQTKKLFLKLKPSQSTFKVYVTPKGAKRKLYQAKGFFCVEPPTQGSHVSLKFVKKGLWTCSFRISHKQWKRWHKRKRKPPKGAMPDTWNPEQDLLKTPRFRRSGGLGPRISYCRPR